MPSLEAKSNNLCTQARRSSEYSEDFESESESHLRRASRSTRSSEDRHNDDDEEDDDADYDDMATYEFDVRRWFAKDEDDGAVVRELVPTNARDGDEKVRQIC